MAGVWCGISFLNHVNSVIASSTLPKIDAFALVMKMLMSSSVMNLMSFLGAAIISDSDFGLLARIRFDGRSSVGHDGKNIKGSPMKTTLNINKELEKHIDAGSNRFKVTLTGGGVEIIGTATHIFGGNSFHIDEEFDRELDAHGIDGEEIVDALEDGLHDIEVEIHLPVAIGDTFYREDILNYPFEVIRVSHSVIYLAIMNGAASKIDYISKSMLEEQLGKTWFRTADEVLESRKAKLQRELDFLS